MTSGTPDLNDIFICNTEDSKITINGDLHVNGNTTQTTVTTDSYTNPYFELGQNNQADILDSGFYMKYKMITGDVRYSGFYRKASDKEFYLVNDMKTEPNPIFEPNTSSQLASLNIGNLYINNETLNDIDEIIYPQFLI